MKYSPLFFSALALVQFGCGPLHAAGYVDWMNDYTGSEAGTLLLWKFDGTYTPGDVNSPALADSAANYQRRAAPPSGNAVAVGSGVSGKWGGGLSIADFERNSAASRLMGGTGITSATDTRDALGSSATTVEFWFQPLTLTLNGAYLADKRYGGNSGAVLRFAGSGSNRLVAEVGNGTAVLQAISANLVWDLETWYHLALTYSAETGSLQVFRDGELVASALNAGFGALDAGGHVWSVGNRAGTNHYSAPGLYDNFRVSDVAYDFSVIPEPSTLALSAGALLLLATGHLRKKRRLHRPAASSGSLLS